MTREDAIFFLNELRSANNCDETIDMAIAALREPVLDENGLVPCGCGGKVEVAFYPGWHGVPDMYQVDCFNCHVGTRPCQTAEQAKAAWNAAMGWRADE